MESNTQDQLLQEKRYAIISVYANTQHDIPNWDEFLESIGVVESRDEKLSIMDPRAFTLACIRYGF